MPARVLGALLALSARGAAGAPDFAAEAAAIGGMMEEVRQRTEGGTAPAAAAALRARPAAAPERFPDLDAQLMGRADEIERQLQESDAAAESARPAKRAALAVERSEAREGQAARFFATHGMGEVGRLLGEELSGSEATRALRAAAESQHFFAGEASPATGAARRAAAPVQSEPAAAGINELDLEFAEEEDARAEKQRWGAVDRLRRRARPA
mmetsp:Transcript_118094/g.367915  ORF Transcript_118094/g.367915 Transcript_118094/m.367915 type:complete len:212 (+) Transcript_118094:107-742(+)